jgi:hypothetical protein
MAPWVQGYLRKTEAYSFKLAGGIKRFLNDARLEGFPLQIREDPEQEPEEDRAAAAAPPK